MSAHPVGHGVTTAARSAHHAATLTASSRIDLGPNTDVGDLVAAVAVVDSAVADLVEKVSSATATKGLDPGDAQLLTQTLDRLDTITSVVGLQRARVSGLVRRTGEWAKAPGVKSFEDWWGRRSRQGPGAAKQERSVGEVLTLMPGVEQAANSGDVSDGHVRVIASVMDRVSEKVRNRLLQREEDILRTATRTTVPELRRHLRSTAAALDSDEEDRAFERVHQRRRLNLTNRAGGVQIDAFLDPVAGARLRLALDAVTPVPAAEDERHPEQRRADALGLLADNTLSSGSKKSSALIRPPPLPPGTGGDLAPAHAPSPCLRNLRPERHQRPGRARRRASGAECAGIGGKCSGQ